LYIGICEIVVENREGYKPVKEIYAQHGGIILKYITAMFSGQCYEPDESDSYPHAQLI
jgi:hypothetical protein